MNRIHTLFTTIVIALAISVINGCSRTDKLTLGDEGEESNTELALNERYDEIRSGARLILTYDAQTNSFKGTVENTTDETLKQVRVEVHLSNGTELGPTPAGDLAPGEIREIELAATGTEFNGWTAHAEVGEGEHSSGESHGAHDSEGGGEHN